MSNVALRLLFSLYVCTCLVVLPACRRHARSGQDPTETFDAYAELPGLQATHDPQLQAEYARLVAERATPQLLDEDAGANVEDPVDLAEVLSGQPTAESRDGS